MNRQAEAAARQGFTLIELLVVIAIISILTIVTVSQFQTAKKKANDVARKGDLNAVSKALQMYFADFGYFPAAVNGELSMLGGGSIWGGTFEDINASPAYVYMKKLPKENFLAAYAYCYKVSTDLKKFALFAQLENTVDRECEGHSYSCNGRTYCYGTTSPNTSLAANGDLQ